jgi:hypothetical protein
MSANNPAADPELKTSPSGLKWKVSAADCMLYFSIVILDQALLVLPLCAQDIVVGDGPKAWKGAMVSGTLDAQSFTSSLQHNHAAH